jgi:hypothetical protein
VHRARRKGQDDSPKEAPQDLRSVHEGVSRATLGALLSHKHPRCHFANGFLSATDIRPSAGISARPTKIPQHLGRRQLRGDDSWSFYLARRLLSLRPKPLGIANLNSMEAA